MRKCVALMAVLSSLSCSDVDLCENTSPVEIPSPDHKLGAWVFIRDCGAITLNSVHVTILPAGSPPPGEAGNTFILEPMTAVTVEWPSERELLVLHERGGKVLKQEQQVAGVAVSYRLE
jgi:hypothetical protein